MWQIVNNVDIEAAKKYPLLARSPFLEMEGLFPPSNNDITMDSTLEYIMNSFKTAENLPSPRVIKSHFPLELLPPNLLDTCKVIFVSRTPKDCAVSFYNHYMNVPIAKFEGTFNDFAELFLEGNVEYGNYWTMLKVMNLYNIITHIHWCSNCLCFPPPNLYLGW